MARDHLPLTQDPGMQQPVLDDGGGCVIELAQNSKRESRLSACYAPRLVARLYLVLVQSMPIRDPVSCKHGNRLKRVELI